jgi:hypothetical protein
MAGFFLSIDDRRPENRNSLCLLDFLEINVSHVKYPFEIPFVFSPFTTLEVFSLSLAGRFQ